LILRSGLKSVFKRFKTDKSAKLCWFWGVYVGFMLVFF